MNEIEISKDQTILTKFQCYKLYNSGAFGNKALTWDSLTELKRSSWRGPICIRNKRKSGGGSTKYNIPFDKIEEEIRKLELAGFSKSELRFNQAMPDEYLRLQGEVMRTESGLALYYSTLKVPMNLALRKNGRQVFRLEAKILLQESLFPNSLDDLEELLTRFPNSAIEFSSYNIPVGNLPRRNTVFWEVRNY